MDCIKKKVNEELEQGWIGCNKACEYNPCHFTGQDCTFCFCPFYPCNDTDLGSELIGKRGQTLDSLQYLTNLAVNKQSDSYIKVKLDTEDYRKRRKETLENLAKNIAYKVKRTKRPVSLEPMNPFERRVIHSALQNDKYVSTHSEGEEPYRHVVVTLKR